MNEKERILELMKMKGWTKYGLAQKSGIDITSIYGWFNNKHTPSKASTEAICETFCITLKEFYNYEQKEEVNVEQQEVLKLYNKLTSEQKRLALGILELLGKF